MVRSQRCGRKSECSWWSTQWRSGSTRKNGSSLSLSLINQQKDKSHTSIFCLSVSVSHHPISAYRGRRACICCCCSKIVVVQWMGPVTGILLFRCRMRPLSQGPGPLCVYTILLKREHSKSVQYCMRPQPERKENMLGGIDPPGCAAALLVGWELDGTYACVWSRSLCIIGRPSDRGSKRSAMQGAIAELLFWSLDS